MKFILMTLVIFSISVITAASTDFAKPKNLDQNVIEVTGYYKTVSGDTAKWNPISLKVKMQKTFNQETNEVNGETYEVVGYKFPFDYGWTDLYYGSSASKVQGNLSEKYSLSAYVGVFTIYFNLC